MEHRVGDKERWSNFAWPCLWISYWVRPRKEKNGYENIKETLQGVARRTGKIGRYSSVRYFVNLSLNISCVKYFISVNCVSIAAVSSLVSSFSSIPYSSNWRYINSENWNVVDGLFFHMHGSDPFIQNGRDWYDKAVSGRLTMRHILNLTIFSRNRPAATMNCTTACCYASRAMEGKATGLC